MLLRIAPDMFKDPLFNCVTVPAVLKEFTRSKKFKKKYPWRTEYKSHIKTLPLSQIEEDSFNFHLSIIHNIHDHGKVNLKTGRYFDLSVPDKKIAAYIVAHDYILSSVDNDLNDFLKQEFDKPSIMPLGIVNKWLEDGILEWDDKKNEILEDWERCNEHPQEKPEIAKFCKLTGRKYIGP